MPGDPSLFRAAALEGQEQTESTGDVLRLLPDWIDRTYTVLLLACGFSVLFCALAQVHEVARGPAVVQLSGRSPIHSTQVGTVAAILVRPGQPVEAGEPIIQLDDTDERAALAQATQRHQTALLEFLRAPDDQRSQGDLANLRREVAQAEHAVEQRVVRAGVGGSIGDIHTREGHRLVPGQLVAAVQQPGSSASVIAILPGHHRPDLQVGQRMELQLRGGRSRRLTATITSIQQEIIGPRQVEQLLGAETAGAIDVQGPALIAEASLEEASGASRYHGMTGEVEVKVRTVPLILALLPGLNEYEE